MRAATAALVGDAKLALLALQLQEAARSGLGRQTMAGKQSESMMMRLEAAAAVPAIMVESGTAAAKATAATAAKAVALGREWIRIGFMDTIVEELKLNAVGECSHKFEKINRRDDSTIIFFKSEIHFIYSYIC
jgi:hypothetical protein